MQYRELVRDVGGWVMLGVGVEYSLIHAPLRLPARA